MLISWWNEDGCWWDEYSYVLCVCVVELAAEVKVHADWPADWEMNIHVLC